ncbi:MAG: hypothetical protein COS94_04955 [Candidatus Hydrogenedentes bacterium CG07_land_8_20_14_0_80_42_17]|nr:MAG: hypothetical protein COS94_04955 [Candidatus Hydrogenedentes bacterium CG07_land_8_20_14_0_80_42_17]
MKIDVRIHILRLTFMVLMVSIGSTACANDSRYNAMLQEPEKHTYELVTSACDEMIKDWPNPNGPQNVEEVEQWFRNHPEQAKRIGAVFSTFYEGKRTPGKILMYKDFVRIFVDKKQSFWARGLAGGALKSDVDIYDTSVLQHIYEVLSDNSEREGLRIIAMDLLSNLRYSPALIYSVVLVRNETSPKTLRRRALSIAPQVNQDVFPGINEKTMGPNVPLDKRRDVLEMAKGATLSNEEFRTLSDLLYDANLSRDAVISLGCQAQLRKVELAFELLLQAFNKHFLSHDRLMPSESNAFVLLKVIGSTRRQEAYLSLKEYLMTFDVRSEMLLPEIVSSYLETGARANDPAIIRILENCDENDKRQILEAIREEIQ